MLLEGLMNLVINLINMIPFEVPQLPELFYTTLNMLLDGFMTSLGIIDIFIDLEFWLQCAGIMLVIYNIKHIYNAVIWVCNWIPGMDPSYWN